MPQELDKNRVLPDNLHPLTLEAIFKFIYPIGSYYFNKTDPRSPNEIFGIGCGTWVAEENYVLAGKASSGTFSTLGAGVGADTNNLTHQHLQTIGADTSAIYIRGDNPNGSEVQSSVTRKAWSLASAGGTARLSYTYNPSPALDNTSIIQRTRVVMMWVRTA